MSGTQGFQRVSGLQACGLKGLRNQKGALGAILGFSYMGL